MDLNSVKAKPQNLVEYDYWLVVNKAVTQSSQIGACDGSRLVGNTWQRRWENNWLVENEKRTDPIRTVQSGSFDEMVLNIACANR